MNVFLLESVMVRSLHFHPNLCWNSQAALLYCGEGETHPLPCGGATTVPVGLLRPLAALSCLGSKATIQCNCQIRALPLTLSSLPKVPHFACSLLALEHLLPPPPCPPLLPQTLR